MRKINRTLRQDFTCPSCGYVIKAPVTKEAIMKHLDDKHKTDATLRARITKSDLLKLQ